jgi:hypothetical protein
MVDRCKIATYTLYLHMYIYYVVLYTNVIYEYYSMVGTILDISELKRMQERETEHFMLKKALEDVSTNA